MTVDQAEGLARIALKSPGLSRTEAVLALVDASNGGSRAASDAVCGLLTASGFVMDDPRFRKFFARATPAAAEAIP